MAAVIKQRAQVFNKPVGVIRTQGGAQQLGQTISNVAGTLTQQAYKIAAEDAQKRGIDVAQSVEEKNLLTFDPETGKPEVFSPPPAFGRIAASAYQDVIDKRFTDSMNSELQLKAKEISLKYQYNPDAYDSVFSDYIGAMSENATGKYKQFIESTGADYLARTKLNIQSRVQSRARANLARSAASSAAQGAENAYELALNGGFVLREGEEVSETQQILSTEVGNVSKAVSTNLLKVGADQKTKDLISLSTARGGVEYLISQTETSAERNALELAIRTRGREVSGVPQGLRSQLNDLLPYIDGGNAGKVLTHASGVSADYNAVERDMIAASQVKAEARARLYEVQFGSSTEGAGLFSSSVAVETFSAEGAYDVAAGVGIASEKFRSLADDVNSRFLSDSSYTETQRDADLKEARQSILRPFLIQAAADGNASELAVAIQTRNPRDMESLTPKQKAFVSSLGNAKILNPIEDMGFVRSELSASQNSIREARDKERAQFKLTQEVTNLGEVAEFGGITEDAYTAMQRRITNSVGVSMTSVQAKSELARLNRQRAFGELNLFSAGATSSALNNLSTYIDSQGQRTAGMSESVIEAGNKILSMTGADDIDALTGKIGGLRVTIANQEAADQKVLEQQQDVTRILGGGGRSNSTKDQKMVQEMLDDIGVDLTQFDSFPDDQKSQVYALIRTVPPTSLLNNLNDIASGVEVPSSEAWLNIFARMESDITSTGGTINRFGKSLNADTVEFLLDVNQIRITTGGNVGQIAQMLRERRNDPKSKINMNIQLDEKTPTEYAMGRVKSDPIVAYELAPVVEYLALTGKSQSQINDRIDTLIDQKYPKSEFIADPRFPVGSIKRSRYSFVAVFPDEGERTAFTQAVEGQLPAGYSLFGDQINNQAGTAKAYANFAPSQEALDNINNAPTDIKQVYLVPDESTAGVTYFTYFVNENRELQPLIYDKDGVRTFPAFDKSETEQYRAQAATDRAAKLREDMDAEELRLEGERASFQRVLKRRSDNEMTLETPSQAMKRTSGR